MIKEKRLSKKKAAPLLLIGLAIFIIYMHFFVGIADIVLILQRVDLFIYSLAFFIAFLDTAFYSLAWQRFLRILAVKASFKKVFLFVWVGTFVDILVPAEAISGEISKAYLASRSFGGNTGKVVASIVGHRIMSVAITLSSLVISSTLFILRYELPRIVLNLIIIVIILTAVYVGFLVLLSMREQMTLKIIDLVVRLLTFIFRGRWHLTQLRLEAQKALKTFHQGIEILGRHPKSLAWTVVFSAIAWILSLFVSSLVFVSLGHSVPLTVIVIVHSISCTVQTIPLGVPGEVGLIEILMTSLYASLGVPLGINAATAAAATVLVRLVNVWFRFLVGLIATQWVGVKAVMDRTEITRNHSFVKEKIE